ncbi:MAG: phosphotransferase, partial [Planctomycetota bacterium]
ELPAPRLVFWDLSRRARLAGADGPARPFVTVETWIEGTPHALLSDAAAAREAALGVAVLLARFHAVRRCRWGRPAAGRARSFVSYTMLGVRRMLRRLESRGWLGAPQARGALAAFADWKETIGRIGTFNLVHNDANRRNFVLTPAGEVMPVDLHRLAYEPFQEELVNVLYHFCRKEEGLAPAFLETYFARAGDEARDAHSSMVGFFKPLHYLKKMYRRAARPLAAPDEKMDRGGRIVLSVEPPR